MEMITVIMMVIEIKLNKMMILFGVIKLEILLVMMVVVVMVVVVMMV